MLWFWLPLCKHAIRASPPHPNCLGNRQLGNLSRKTQKSKKPLNPSPISRATSEPNTTRPSNWVGIAHVCTRGLFDVSVWPTSFSSTMADRIGALHISVMSKNRSLTLVLVIDGLHLASLPAQAWLPPSLVQACTLPLAWVWHWVVHLWSLDLCTLRHTPIWALCSV